MELQPVIAIFDIGKTNKKLFLFSEEYKIVFERSEKVIETTDEDGYPCDNIESLKHFVFESLRLAVEKKEFSIKAINFSTYGASFVYLDEQGHVLAPLYNYLKPYAELLRKQFYDEYGGEEEFSRITASPVLGSLNSGMQLYRIKYEKPDLFSKIKYALHLPQYMSFLISGEMHTDITSIGCHTNLWDFTKQHYHAWVGKEKIESLLPAIMPYNHVMKALNVDSSLLVGVGLHDSSAALIPYLMNFPEPFVLISSGTWCISLNPFNHAALTIEELKQDTLCYMQFNGKPVKASRLFAGYEHDKQTERIALFFEKKPSYYKEVIYNPSIVKILNERGSNMELDFSAKDLSAFSSYEVAYHQLVMDIVRKQIASTDLVLRGTSVSRIFVDGGFTQNQIFMNLIANAYQHIEVYAASIPQASALGAALVLHSSWNSKQIPNDLVQLQFYRNEKNIL